MQIGSTYLLVRVLSRIICVGGLYFTQRDVITFFFVGKKYSWISNINLYVGKIVSNFRIRLFADNCESILI